MTFVSRALHHFHVRKRIHENLEVYPHPDKWKNLLDRVIVFIGVLAPIMTLPQLYNIMILKQTDGVSFITWFTYLFVALTWLLYGLSHKEKPIIITYISWAVIDILIIIGLILY